MRDNEEIIIKKVKRAHSGHHAGAWKVAYADFVTAMMALFMVLWIIALLSTRSKAGVAQYFRSFTFLEGQDSTGGDRISHMPGEAILLQELPGGFPGATDWERRLEEGIQKELEANLAEAQDQVFIVRIEDGVRIEMVERTSKAMFNTGESVLLPHGEKLLEIIAKEITALPFPSWIEGHTDAFPFAEKETYSNWELSVDRANAVRRYLVSAGITEDRIKRVIGYAATYPFVREDPFSDLNRRVSIVIKDRQEKGEEEDNPYENAVGSQPY